jgi:eukaryotic-like serine/threonine-protein kinase
MIGQTISHYKILTKLGEGGMGVVYKAEDTKLKRLVAIKFLPRQIAASEEERERFKIEAQAAAALNHPNIATIHAIEEIDGDMFIVMEFIDGEELRKLLIDNGQLSIDNCLNYAAQIASGLQAAHAKGVTHRDIKSSNIMVTESGQVKIMDFGLAKIAGGAQLTKDHSTLGTAAYMSPEQARGEPVDHRTDIWALGVVLYEMLTGQLPFRGVYEQAMIYSILNENPQPISDLRAETPEALQHIVQKALAKEASQRYQSADELLGDLQALRVGQVAGISTSRMSGARRAVSQRNRIFLYGGVVIVLLLIAGYFFFGREAAAPTERVPIAVVDFVNETNEPELNGLSGMLITALEQSRRLAVFSRARMYDEFKQLNRPDLTFVDETAGREIAKRANITALAIATIRNFDDLYTIDFRVIDPRTGDRLFSTKVEAQGKKSIPGLLDQLSEKTRIDLKEDKSALQLASRSVADVTTTNLEAYQHYFLGEQLMNQIKPKEAQDEYRQAIALDSTLLSPGIGSPMPSLGRLAVPRWQGSHCKKRLL